MIDLFARSLLEAPNITVQNCKAMVEGTVRSRSIMIWLANRERIEEVL